MLVGALPEPITTTKDPMAKVLYGVPFTGCPRAIAMDIKADVGHEVIRGTGFSKLKPMGYPDSAEITVMLQKRWEDENGVVHALRVGTAIWRISEDIPEWRNGYQLKINYGDITGEPWYRDYMGLKTEPYNKYNIKLWQGLLWRRRKYGLGGQCESSNVETNNKLQTKSN